MWGGVLAGVGHTCVRSLAAGGRRGRLRAIALRRAPRARRAAAEAALDDPAFAPERIEAAVEAILPLVWTLELDETTHAHPRWRLAGSADGS